MLLLDKDCVVLVPVRAIRQLLRVGFKCSEVALMPFDGRIRSVRRVDVSRTLHQFGAAPEVGQLD